MLTALQPQRHREVEAVVEKQWPLQSQLVEEEKQKKMFQCLLPSGWTSRTKANQQHLVQEAGKLRIQLST
jgi:hypothetical protein